MSPSRSTRVRSPLPALMAGVLLSMAMAGCSSTPRSHQTNWSAAGDPQQAAQAKQARREAEVEDDGMEAQVAPPPSIRLAPDDPREPYSPNYGTRPADAPAALPSSPAARPSAPPALRPTIRPRYASVGQ